MSHRTVKRVPLDFDWPQHEVWKGYLGEKEFEPPEGPGWQLWETVSEGSPVGPVFATAEDLATWAVDNATLFADIKTYRENWLALILETDGMDVDTGSMAILQDGKLGVLGNF